MRITITRPDSSTRVSTTFALTLSLTPRRLTAITRAMNASATSMISALLASHSMPVARLEAKAREAVDADVMPEHMTANATMKVKKWTPKALWTYRAAPAAWGYLVTS